MNRPGLHLRLLSNAEGGGFEPPVRLRARQFSKLLVSATHPSFLKSMLAELLSTISNAVAKLVFLFYSSKYYHVIFRFLVKKYTFLLIQFVLTSDSSNLLTGLVSWLSLLSKGIIIIPKLWLRLLLKSIKKFFAGASSTRNTLMARSQKGVQSS